MYPAQWATPDRLHTVEEACMFPFMKATGADLYLAVLDSYDVLLSGVEGEIPVSREMCEKLREKITEALVFRYDSLKDRIPGRLKGWTNAMLLFVCAALAGVQGTSHNIIPPDMREWMKKERLRVNKSYDVLEWTYTDLLASLECLEAKWHTKSSWGPFISDYLRLHEHCIDNLISRTSPMFLIDYAVDRAGKDPYSLKPTAIHDVMSRIITMRRSLGIRGLFRVRPRDVPENNQWDQFVSKEARHLTTRAFRNTVGATVWESMLRPSDADRAEYARKAAVSSFGCISKERSLDVVDAVSELFTYKDADEILRDPRTQNGLAISMVHAMTMGTYNVPFKEYFCVFEKNILKHKEVLPKAPVPLLIQRSGRWDVLWKGQIYEVAEPKKKEGSQGSAAPLYGRFVCAFVVWCLMVRSELGGVLFGNMDVRLLISQCLDRATVKVGRKLRRALPFDP